MDEMTQELHKACYNGNLRKLMEIVTPENANSINDDGLYPIQTAMLGFNNISRNSPNYIHIAMKLIDNGANPTYKSSDKHKSAIDMKPAIGQLLYTYFLDVNQNNKSEFINEVNQRNPVLTPEVDY